MHRTSTPENKQKPVERQDTPFKSEAAPSEKTLSFIRQFARSCRAMATSHTSLSIVNVN